MSESQETIQRWNTHEARALRCIFFGVWGYRGLAPDGGQHLSKNFSVGREHKPFRFKQIALRAMQAVFALHQALKGVIIEVGFALAKSVSLRERMANAK